MTGKPVLGALRGATIICPAVADAITAYTRGLGYRLIEEGTVSAALAASWGTPGHAGAACAVLGPESGAHTFLRFIERRDATAGPPYATLGWNAIEVSVQSCDAVVARLAEGPFEILGPPQDLEFSKGALRAGQLLGPFGEILYITQINAQIDDYVLPQATTLADQLFIVILGANKVDRTYSAYEAMGTIAKPTFEAAVDFVNRYQNMPLDHIMTVGCIETAPCSYIEVDESPVHIPPRAADDGFLPNGVALVSFECADLAGFEAQACGGVATHRGESSGTGRSVVVKGPFGELIELIATS